MSMKPFEIQGAELVLGGVQLQAGTTGVVIPGVTQAANYRVEEVKDVDDQTYSNFPSESEVVVVDAALYNAIVNELDENHFADYTATTDDDGEIDEIEVNGHGTYTQQESNTASGNDMYAYVGSSSASDRPLVPEDWVQIPFRPKMRAGEVENIGGGSGSGSSLTNDDWELALSEGRVTLIDDNGGDHSLWMARGDQLLLDGLGGDVVLSANDDVEWEFGTDGGLTFPDGSVQTTAYTGQTGGSSGLIYIMANVDGNIVTSTDGVTWGEPRSSGMAGIDRLAVNNGTIVYAYATSDGPDLAPTLPGLYYSTTIGTVELCVGTDVLNSDNLYWNQLRYFSESAKWVAVGYVDGGTNESPIVAHSSNGIVWTLVPVDNTFVSGFNPTNLNWSLTDITWLAETQKYAITSSLVGQEVYGGIFVTADITTALNGDVHVPIEFNSNKIAPWPVQQYGGPSGYCIIFDTNNANVVWYGDDIDPENYGSDAQYWTESIINDIGYVPVVSEVAFDGDNWIATTDSGQVITWTISMGPDGYAVNVPSPYTSTVTDIVRGTTTTITLSGGLSPDSDGEIVRITGVTSADASEPGTTEQSYNVTKYIKNNNGTYELYNDQGLTEPWDTTSFWPINNDTGTLTWSHGTYFDAAGAAGGYYYIGNDDEQVFRSTNGITWTELADVNGEYFNDFAHGTFGGGTADTGDVTFSTNVVEGSGWELGLSPGPDFTTGAYTSDNDGPDLGPQYFRVRGGDNYEHLHFDTTDNSAFDLYIGDDDTYFKLSKNGQAVIGTEARTEPYDRYNWTFGINGTLTFPDGTTQTSSLEPELTKTEGRIVANANITFGENNKGLIAVVDSIDGDNTGQWFNAAVGDTDGVMYAAGENDNGPQYIWAFNPDGTVKWKVGIDDIDEYNLTPRTLTINGDVLIVGVTYVSLATEEREIGVLTLNKLDGTVNSSYTYSTNNVGTKRIRDFAVDSEGNHILVGSLDGETINDNNLTPIKTSWGSNVNILTVANSSLSSPIIPWSYNFQVQNDPQDVNAWYSPDAVNYFRDLTVTTVTGTGGSQYYEAPTDYTDGQLQLVVGNSGTTWMLRLDATWVNGAAQAHLLAQNGTYQFTIAPGDYTVSQVTAWTDVGGGIYEAGVSVEDSLADGSGNINSIIINKTAMTVELRYVPTGLTNGDATGGMIDSYNVQNQGQGYASGNTVKVLGSQMGGIDTITLTGVAYDPTSNENLYFLVASYPGFSVVQNGWRVSGPGIDGWATLSNVQSTGGMWRFDVPPGITLQAGETYTIDNNGNDIVMVLGDWGGGPYINYITTGKVADEVAATTRIIMSQGVDYRGTPTVVLYSAGTEYTAGQVHAAGNGPWYVTVNSALTTINSEMTLGKEIVLRAGSSFATVTILDVLGIIEDGEYSYEVSDISGLGSNGIDLDSIQIPDGNYTGTWNLRRGLDSQAFIITDSWKHTFGGTDYEQFNSVVYDSFDNSVYAFGEFYDNGGMALFKFDYSTGNTTWVKTVEDAVGSGDAGSVAVDGTGNVYVCATDDEGESLVTKLDSTGTLVWQVKQSNSDNWNNQPTCVLDTNGDIIIGGSYYNQNDPEDNHNLWSFMKLSKVDGSLIWARYLDNQEKYNMYDMEDYDTDVMSIQGDDIYYAGMAYDTNDNNWVALSFKFNTNGEGIGTNGRWIFSADTNAEWVDNTSNAVITSATIPDVDQTVFTLNSGSISVTSDAVGDVTPFGFVLGGSGKLVFVDDSELTTAGIARHSLDSGDNSVWLTASMNGKFRYYANNPGGYSSTIYVPTNANTPLPIGFTLTVVMGDFNGSRVYVNNDGNSDVQFIVSGNDSFGTNYWQFNANTGAAGVYTIMKVDTDTWMLAGPDITAD